MPTRDLHTRLLAAKCHLAGLQVIRALRVLIQLTEPKFNPGQLRVPAGKPHGGQWTKPGGDGGGGNTTPTDGGTNGGTESDPLPVDETPAEDTLPADTTDTEENPNFIPVAGGRRQGPSEGTPAQQARLSTATTRAQEAVTRVQELDPTWRGPESASSGIEGRISHQEGMARAAEDRLSEIYRDGLGGNGGPSLGRGETPPRFSMPQAPYATDAYRSNWDVPNGKGTIAVGTIDNDERTIIGVNSRAPGYTNEDRATANAMRENLLISDADVLRTDNTGYKPNDALYHAEATALMRAARMNGGTLYGRTLDFFVDREMCPSCDKVLPLIAREYGYPTVRFTDIYGNVHTLRNGVWK
jgi:hypothetical protein